MAKNDGSVLIVVLNYGGWRDTLIGLKSLLKQTYHNFKILLIDNGSQNDSADRLKKYIVKNDANQKIIFVQNKKNIGVAPGFAQGVDYAADHSFEFVALFNNDAQAAPDWLEKLVSSSRKHRSFITTGLMLTLDGKTIINSGDIYTRWGIPEQRDENKPVAKASSSGWIFGATGGAVLYRTELFNKIGNFDGKLFAYDEDVDIDWRAQLRGCGTYYEASAVVRHKVGATSKKLPGFLTTQVLQNLPVVFWKNVPARLLWPIGWRFFLAYWAFVFYKICQGDFVPAMKGVGRAIKLWPHALRERRRIQKSKTVRAKDLKPLIKKTLPFRSVARVRKFFHLKIDDFYDNI
ncbi:MAG: glycosyltransferase family 2 protein [Candidatus Nomurabacteria bacterium]|jgi:GT2 family glycosyltransferase|nr:glycosyltransferase family 2 protein [Candidatus Nomurabacteria bacterium]